jgi:hypothetical protein
MEKNNDLLPNCRICADFEMACIRTGRYMGICHEKHCTLIPKFPNNNARDSKYINLANFSTVVFEPLDNCPHIEKLRAEGKLPWATTIADFLIK